MASLRNAPPRLRNYFKDNYIPQICEVTPELMIKACTFYTGNLVKSHFGVWKEIAIPHANQEAIMAEKMEKAIAHDNFRCQKHIFNRWFSYTVKRRERLIATLLRLRHLFYTQKQRIILAKWKEKARHKSKKREDDLITKHELQLKKWKFKLSLEKPINIEGSFSDFGVSDKRIVFDISLLPDQAIVQVCRCLLNSIARLGFSRTSPLKTWSRAVKSTAPGCQ